MTYDYYVALDRKRYDLQAIESVTTHYHHLAADGRKKTADELRATWQAMRLSNQDVPEPALQAQLEKPDFNVDLFPPFTLWLQFPFRLTKAYLSKDERDFYVVDNPIRRDKVSRLPYVAPSTWKGSLRATLWNLGHDADEPAIRQLFGNEQAAEENFRAGRLRFFPTFFKRHSLEIINPHDRKRRVGKNPILFESVPPGTTGAFFLLYIPFDQIGDEETETRRRVAQDLRLIAEGVQAMFCTYGFGAKTSSGFGTAVDNFVDKQDQRRDNLPEGYVHLKAVLREPEAIHTFQKKYGRLTEFSPDEWDILIEGDPEMSRAYQAARQAQERHQHNIQTGQIGRAIKSFEDTTSVINTWATRLSEEASDA
jgi:hypothetical protein